MVQSVLVKAPQHLKSCPLLLFCCLFYCFCLICISFIRPRQPPLSALTELTAVKLKVPAQPITSSPRQWRGVEMAEAGARKPRGRAEAVPTVLLQLRRRGR